MENKNKKKANSSIKCNVESCKHNDSEEGSCTLEEIEVDCTCDNCECTDTKETICKSFDSDSDDNSEDQEDKQKEE